MGMAMESGGDLQVALIMKSEQDRKGTRKSVDVGREVDMGRGKVER